MDRCQEQAIEQDCQKVMSLYLNHVDRHEFEQAVALFTLDADWCSHGVRILGREKLLVALRASLSKGTIRHVISNSVVTVRDVNHAVLRDYHTLYYSDDTDYEPQIKKLNESRRIPIPLKGPHRMTESTVELIRRPEGWRISRNYSLVIFRRDPEKLVPLEIWAKGIGKLV